MCLALRERGRPCPVPHGYVPSVPDPAQSNRRRRKKEAFERYCFSSFSLRSTFDNPLTFSLSCLLHFSCRVVKCDVPFPLPLTGRTVFSYAHVRPQLRHHESSRATPSRSRTRNTTPTLHGDGRNLARTGTRPSTGQPPDRGRSGLPAGARTFATPCRSAPSPRPGHVPAAAPPRGLGISSCRRRPSVFLPRLLVQPRRRLAEGRLLARRGDRLSKSHRVESALP